MYLLIVVPSDVQFLEVTISKQTDSFAADILVIFVRFIGLSFSFNKVRHDILHIKCRDIILRLNQWKPLCTFREITTDSLHLVHWFTCCYVFPLLRKIILPTIFDITDDPATSKTSRYRTYASKFNNYKWQKNIQSAFVALERALPSFAVPLRNDSHSFSLSLVRFCG